MSKYWRSVKHKCLYGEHIWTPTPSEGKAPNFVNAQCPHSRQTPEHIDGIFPDKPTEWSEKGDERWFPIGTMPTGEPVIFPDSYYDWQPSTPTASTATSTGERWSLAKVMRKIFGQ